MSAEDVAACILKTKLYAPKIPDVIHRDSLLWKISDADKAKLTTVVAGAGYGKSTLANLFMTQRAESAVWYQLEETDRDLHEFISYLLTGMGMKISGFGEETLGRLQAADDMVKEEEATIFTLLSEMDDRIGEDFVIILDDFQNVNDSPPITRALDLLIRHMPDNIHMVILSRSKLNLDLPTLAGRRELVEITEDDLRFTPRETVELFSKIFGFNIDDEKAAAFCNYTEGWITGLILFCLVVKEKGEKYIEEAVRNLDVPPSKIADYLSGVVFEGQDENVREFLTRTSLLSQMNPSFCDSLLGIESSKKILKDLVDSRIFTFDQDDKDEWFRYHHVFQQFLRNKLLESCTEEDVTGLHLNAASLWDEWDETEQALHHYMKAKAYDSAAEILDKAAPKFLDANRISFLHENCRCLPEDVVWKYPWLTHQLGEIAHLEGDYKLAIEASKHAAELFKESDDTEAMLNAMIRTGLAMFETGRIDEYEKTATELIEQVPVGSTSWYSLSSVLGKYSIFTGKYDLANRFTDNAMDHIYKIEDKTLKSNLLFSSGMVLFHTGDYRESCRMIQEAYELAESVGNTTFAMNMICVLAPAEITLGNFEEGLDLAEKALAMREKADAGIPFAYLYLVSKASALSLLGDEEGARRATESALEVSKSCDYGAEVMYAHYFMAGLQLHFGNKDRALRHYDIAKHIARDIPFVIVEQLSRLGELQVSYREIGFEPAIDEARSIASYVKENYNDTFSVHPFIIQAFLELSAGKESRAREAVHTAAELTESSRAFGLWNWAMTDNIEVKRVLLPLIEEMFSRGEHVDVFSKVFEYVGADSIPFLGELSKSKDSPMREKAGELLEAIKAKSLEPLYIKTLGPFEVIRGGEKIRPRDWKSRKALAIIKYLASQEEGRSVSREVLMELLWPGSIPESASKNLGVALSYLRKILEPDGIKGESSYIVSDGDAIRLELGKGGAVDFKLFRTALKEAEENGKLGKDGRYLEELRRGEELYQGKFMEEDLYDDWCRQEREKLQNEYLELLLKISSECCRLGDLSEALSYMEKAINADPGREDFYRAQMEIYAGLGNRAGIEDAYRNCCEYLSKNYDVKPSPETVDVYHRLRGD